MIACEPVAAPRIALLALVGVVACYHGYDVEDKQVPPGYAGGQCQGSACIDGSVCYVDEGVCIDPLDPCKGIYCAGYGTCAIDYETNIPFCTCDPGFTNEPYAYFCIPIGL